MRSAIGLALVTHAMAVPALAADDAAGTWQVHLRASRLHPDDDNNTAPNLALRIKDKNFLEAGLTHYFTPRLATALVLTYPQELRLTSDRSGIATVK